MHACMHSKVVKFLKVASKEPCHLLWAAACISMIVNCGHKVPQLYKRRSEAAVTGNVGYRQVQLEQGIVHCIVLLED